MLNLITKFLSFIFLILISTSSIWTASPQQDYDYRLTQYRKNHTEFQTLKTDNQKNPTLDNQQKALQAAKQTIVSRDTAKIAYIELLLSQIESQHLTQDYLLQTEKELVNAQKFYQSQIKLAKDIVSVEDLTNFTLKYLETQTPYQNQIIKAQATRKLAILIRLQINAKNAYNDLLPKISDKSTAPVTAGLTRISQLADNINQKILTNTITIKDSEVTNYSKPNFYSKQTESLSQIKTLQVELINILIDLEKNYAN